MRRSALLVVALCVALLACAAVASASSSEVSTGVSASTAKCHVHFKTTKAKEKYCKLKAHKHSVCCAKKKKPAPKPHPSPNPTPQPSPSPSPPPSDGLTPATVGMPSGLSGYTLVWNDEFDASALDRKKWAQGWYASDPDTSITTGVQNTDDMCYDPKRVAVAGGALELSMIKQSISCGGSTRDVATGMVTTKESGVEFTYGFFEARIWLTAGPDGHIANWPAWWLVGNSDKYGAWPGCGELDILEGMGKVGQPCWHFHSPSGGPGGCQNVVWGGAWHTYAAEWTADAVNYYYDGHLVGTISQGLTHTPMYLLLNYATTWQDGQYLVGGPEVQPSVMKVDYVRVYQKK